MADIADFTALIPRDHGLSVVSVLRADGSISSSVVNAGVLPHPVSGTPVVAFTTRRSAAKLTRLRARPQATVTIRAGWQWAAAEGQAELIGPDDPADEVDADGVRLLLREVFMAAGGTHDDWPAYDRVMADEGRAAVLLTPARIYSNPAEPEGLS